MRVPPVLLRVLDAGASAVMASRPPDFLVGGGTTPYLRRWWLIPRNRWCNVYLHEFLRDDDDRALHDHPWAWCSLMLRGIYAEHTAGPDGTQDVRHRCAGSVSVHGPRFAHRLTLPDWRSCRTIFITGPAVRTWGFRCPHAWVPWREFTCMENGRSISRGCGE